MTIHLTERELIALGYDHPSNYDPADAGLIDAIRRKTRHRGKLVPLNPTEVARLKWDVKYLPSSGEANPADVAVSTRLRNKVYGDE